MEYGSRAFFVCFSAQALRLSTSAASTANISTANAIFRRFLMRFSFLRSCREAVSIRHAVGFVKILVVRNQKFVACFDCVQQIS